MKADLHYHGPIGFQDYWLRKQGYHRERLLHLIADTCLDKRLDICALTSDEDEIPKGSIHDRLGYLTGMRNLLPPSYKFHMLGPNIAVVEKQRRAVFLVNGQTVRVREGNRKIDHLVVGTNEVPNNRSLAETISYGNDHGLIQIAEHPYVEIHDGLGEALLEKHLEDYDAVEGHNSQLVLPVSLSRLPVISQLTRESNENARDYAAIHNKPWIAVSDGHRIESAGLSYIALSEQVDISTEDKFLQSLRQMIRSKRFIPIGNYESFKDWFKWVVRFEIGTTLKKDKELKNETQ